jgi:hypothetical protein
MEGDSLSHAGRTRGPTVIIRLGLENNSASCRLHLGFKTPGTMRIGRSCSGLAHSSLKCISSPRSEYVLVMLDTLQNNEQSNGDVFDLALVIKQLPD